ncbi:WD40 repeat domain-containing protein [Deinococcus apachensis]|uniref:WD40 repeat domain-containing protein n=1 Tax=Deinococcus apachensis TaxID=309886 RepID=UPI00035C50D2|nr:WD40 repeat domain-containing protein [Deinococcus apachensis]
MRSLLLTLLLGSAALAAPLTPLQTATHPNAHWAFHVDSQKAVAVDYDGAAAVLFPRHGSPLMVKFTENGKLRAPLVTPEGRVLAVGLDFPRCEVAVWDVSGGRKVTALRGDFTKVFGCDRAEGTEFIFNTQFTPDGRFLLTQDAASLRRWDARRGTLLKNLPGTFLSVNVSPDGRRVAAISQNRRVEVWASDLSRRLKVTPPQPADCFRGPGAWPTEVNWSPDSTRLAFSCDREVRVWNVADGGLQSLGREARRESPDTPTFSPDGRFVVADEDQFGAAVWNVGNGQRVAQLRLDAPNVQVTDVKVTPQHLLLAALDDGRVVRLDLNRPAQALEPLVPFPSKPGLWPSLAVSREGDRLAVASGDGRLNIYALPGK